MTGFEIASIVIGCFTALGTVGATVVAVAATIPMRLNWLSKKNFEQRLNLEEYKSYDDIVVRNKSNHDVTINTIFFTCNEKDYHIDSVYYSNKRVKLPIVLKPMESFHIKNLLHEVLIGIVPYNDYLFVKDDSKSAPHESFYAKYYNDSHIKFTIIDSEQHKSHFTSKYTVAEYLQDYINGKLLSPWKINTVQEHVKNKKTTCIICGNWQKDFEIYSPNSKNISVTDIEEQIEQLASDCLDEYDTNSYGFAFVSEDGIKYYIINDDEDSDTAKSIIIETCSEVSLESISKYPFEYLIWDPDEDMKEYLKKKISKKNRDDFITFDELIKQQSQNSEDKKEPKA